MRTVTRYQVELIDAVIAEKATGGLTPSIIEKDIHVTDALQTLFSIRHEHVDFVFCGGTSLSKAYGIIERMSEDVDIKVVLSDGHGMTRSATKKCLIGLKHKVIRQMTNLGFVQDASGYKVFNENRYVATNWLYQSRYEGMDESLRPHLSLEFTVRTPKFLTIPVSIGYLVDKLAERQGLAFPINCIAVEETLAEKVLSFLRRHAQHRCGYMQQPWDTALVRHIYDIYCIVQADPETVEKAKSRFADLVAFDVKEFTKHPAFTENPKACMSAALEAIEAEEQTFTEYQTRLLPLIYADTKPGFAEAFKVFKTSSHALLSTL